MELSIYVTSPATSPSNSVNNKRLFTLAKLPASDALSINGNTGNADNTGFAGEMESALNMTKITLYAKVVNRNVMFKQKLLWWSVYMCMKCMYICELTTLYIYN